MFPPALAERCIKAGTSEKGACGACGAPWVRVTEPSEEYAKHLGKGHHDHSNDMQAGMMQPKHDGWKSVNADYRTTGWKPTCPCDADIAPCVALDPFGGAGTVSLVAERLGRDSIYIDLSPAYTALARKRIYNDAPMFAAIESGA